MSDELKIAAKRCDYEVIKPFKTQCSKERVTLDNPSGSVWIAAFNDDKVIGFVCLVVTKARSARFKSDYVLPEYRGRGIYGRLFALRMALCGRLGVKKATAFCTPLSLPTYVKNGFQRKSVRGDITFVERSF
jgi:GNAT superfamily N-acetyltransferase